MTSPHEKGIEAAAPPTEASWPSHGAFGNVWNNDLAAFAAILQQASGLPAWWAFDPQLKYLEIRVDTRDGGFVLKDRDGTLIHPNRVLAAIAKSRKRWGRSLAEDAPAAPVGSAGGAR